MAGSNDKSRKAYNKKADHYDSTFDGNFTRKFKDLLTSVIELPDNANVLDVACGNGALLSALNKRKPINGFGVDVADRMVQNAASANPGMEFKVAGCEEIPFQDNIMDIITVSAAYHHFPDVTAFAREAKRLLKRNGTVYIADVYLPSVLRLICNPFLPLSRAGDVKFYSPKEIVDNFIRAGFTEKGIKISGHIQVVSMTKS